MTGPDRLLTIAVALAMVTVTLPTFANAQLQPIDDPGATCPSLPSGLPPAVPSGAVGACVGLYAAVQVDAGAHHACTVLETGNVTCWGANGTGQAEGYTGADAAEVSTERSHSCVLTEDGNVECWGANDRGQAEPYTAGDAVEVTTGLKRTCVLTEAGNVDCWGLDRFNSGRDYNGGDAVQVDAGRSHNCAVLDNGDVHCWGGPFFLADARVDRTQGDAVQVTAAKAHTCALLENGNVECWGDDDLGRTEGYDGGDAVEADSHWTHGCARLDGGAVECWGYNADGQANPHNGIPPATQVTTGIGFTCAILATGDVDCWGDNSFGKAAGYLSLLPPTSSLVTPRRAECEPTVPGVQVCDPDGDGVPDEAQVGLGLESVGSAGAFAKVIDPEASDNGKFLAAEGQLEKIGRAEVTGQQSVVWFFTVTSLTAGAETFEESPVGHNEIEALAVCLAVGTPLPCLAIATQAGATVGEDTPLGKQSATAVVVCTGVFPFGVCPASLWYTGIVQTDSEQAGEHQAFAQFRQAQVLTVCVTGDQIPDSCESVPLIGS